MRVLVDECLPRATPGVAIRSPTRLDRDDGTRRGLGVDEERRFAAQSRRRLRRAGDSRQEHALPAKLRGSGHLQDISVLVLPSNRAQIVRAGVLALVQSIGRARPGEKTIMRLAEAADWSVAQLAEVVVEQGITRHVFRP